MLFTDYLCHLLIHPVKMHFKMLKETTDISVPSTIMYLHYNMPLPVLMAVFSEEQW